jgi:hypothetical protein
MMTETMNHGYELVAGERVIDGVHSFEKELPAISKEEKRALDALEATGYCRGTYFTSARFKASMKAAALGLWDDDTKELTPKGRRLRDALAEARSPRPIEWHKFPKLSLSSFNNKKRYTAKRLIDGEWKMGWIVGEVDGVPWWTNTSVTFEGEVPEGVTRLDIDNPPPIKSIVPVLDDEAEELMPFASAIAQGNSPIKNLKKELVPQIILRDAKSGNMYSLDEKYYLLAKAIVGEDMRLFGWHPEKAIAVVDSRNRVVGVMMPMCHVMSSDDIRTRVVVLLKRPKQEFSG